MSIAALLIGVIVALIILKYVHGSKNYALLLASFPLYYFAFAIYANDWVALLKEVGVGMIFFIIAAISPRYLTRYRWGLLAAGLLLHGFYDLVHGDFFINAGTPQWWPEFCGVVDLILGFYLLFYAYNLPGQAKR